MAVRLRRWIICKRICRSLLHRESPYPPSLPIRNRRNPLKINCVRSLWSSASGVLGDNHRNGRWTTFLLDAGVCQRPRSTERALLKKTQEPRMAQASATCNSCPSLRPARWTNQASLPHLNPYLQTTSTTKPEPAYLKPYLRTTSSNQASLPHPNLYLRTTSTTKQACRIRTPTSEPRRPTKRRRTSGAGQFMAAGNNSSAGCEAAHHQYAREKTIPVLAVDAVTALTVFLALQLGIPSSLRIPALGGVGYLRHCGLCAWVCGGLGHV